MGLVRTKLTNSSGNGSKSARKVTGEKRRLNLKLDEELVAWAFAYAERRKTSVTQMITDFIINLQRHESVIQAEDAEQA